MNRVFLLLGSNVDKEKNLPMAIALLRQMCHVVAVSTVYETTPRGLREQPNFFNTAVLVETDLSAGQLKAGVLSELERRLNRQRTADKNAPRTIDADIVLFNDDVFDYEYEGRRRHTPDPDLLKYPHVAVPIAELAPDMPHPETAEPLSAIAARLLATTGQASNPPLWPRPDIELS